MFYLCENEGTSLAFDQINDCLKLLVFLCYFVCPRFLYITTQDVGVDFIILSLNFIIGFNVGGRERLRVMPDT